MLFAGLSFLTILPLILAFFIREFSSELFLLSFFYGFNFRKSTVQIYGNQDRQILKVLSYILRTREDRLRGFDLKKL